MTKALGARDEVAMAPTVTMELSLSDYAYRHAISYHAAYAQLLRGKIAGYRDERGRWRVVVATGSLAGDSKGDDGAPTPEGRHPCP